ncbi:hypothetical protein INP83_11160 [Mucilaginibacter sp. 21P]|uniref:hypothetical protein n=1 Tax=Mucilaginibacter sp. 21P TaxID=2778902 RepID=UPI001C55CD1C|nr:hypothetical protein [Mucilaginibacter sp. 21P]QXV63671.1 hypothetical protein INP83_11160 [Mucilaginibacter sp. 21P]
MWRKIHSNRDPRNTLYSELRREFGCYFSALSAFISELLNTYPRLVFWLMIVLLLSSASLSFTIFRHPENKPDPQVKAISPVTEGFSRIMESAAKIRKGLQLKRMVDSLIAKKVLTHQDSITLENALDSLQQIQK